MSEKWYVADDTLEAPSKDQSHRWLAAKNKADEENRIRDLADVARARSEAERKAATQALTDSDWRPLVASGHVKEGSATSILHVPGEGCFLRVSTWGNKGVAESITWAPGIAYDYDIQVDAYRWSGPLPSAGAMDGWHQAQEVTK